MTASALPEQELIGRAKAGDTQAFEELMRRNQGKIYNLGMKLLRNREDAADLLQETFIKAYESLPRFEEKSSFSTWIYRIAVNFALMKLRREKRRKVSFDELKEAEALNDQKSILNWSSNPQAHLKNKELRAVIDEAIASLPPKYKTVFLLHDIDDLPIARVGEILSLSVPAVKSRVHRSRLFLRQKLAKYFEKGPYGDEMLPNPQVPV